MNKLNDLQKVIKATRFKLGGLEFSLSCFDRRLTAEFAKEDRSEEKAYVILDEMEVYRNEFREQLMQVARLGKGFDLTMTACRRIAVALEASDVDPVQFVVDAKIEIDGLTERTKTLIKPSRQKPEHPITKWVRRYRSKYASNTDAVRAYLETHDGKYATVLQDLKNDLRKKPLLNTKKTS